MRWQIVTAIDIITELVFVALAALLVHDLKMSLSNKSMVVIAFLFRLPYVAYLAILLCRLTSYARLIAFATLHLHYLAGGITSTNPPLDLVGAIVWAQIELHYSNIAATVPCLKPFMSAVSTNYGATEPAAMTTSGGSKLYGSSGSRSRPPKRKGSSYALGSMGKDRRGSMGGSRSGIFRMARRGPFKMNSETFGEEPSGTGNGHMVVQQGKTRHDSNSIGSNDSRKMIIKKEVNIKVERDGSSGPDEEMGIEPMDAGRAV